MKRVNPAIFSVSGDVSSLTLREKTARVGLGPSESVSRTIIAQIYLASTQPVWNPLSAGLSPLPGRLAQPAGRSTSPFHLSPRGLKQLRVLLSPRTLRRCLSCALWISGRCPLGRSLPGRSLSSGGGRFLCSWFLSLDTQTPFQHRFEEFLLGRRHRPVEVLRTPREQGVQFAKPFEGCPSRMGLHLPHQAQRRREIRYRTEAPQRFFAITQLEINSG